MSLISSRRQLSGIWLWSRLEPCGWVQHTGSWKGNRQEWVDKLTGMVLMGFWVGQNWRSGEMLRSSPTLGGRKLVRASSTEQAKGQGSCVMS